MHEVLAGDYFHEELESVPEQTWSSASFFTTAVNGLLGLQIDGVSNRLTFAPHLPPGWTPITLRHLRVRGSEITINMVQSIDQLRLRMQNEGAPVQTVFHPEVPFGTRSIVATLEQNLQDTHARVEFTLPHGSALLTLGCLGGVVIMPAPPQPVISDPGAAIKLGRSKTRMARPLAPYRQLCIDLRSAGAWRTPNPTSTGVARQL
jgi:hypothetical protein